MARGPWATLAKFFLLKRFAQRDWVRHVEQLGWPESRKPKRMKYRFKP